LKRRPVADVEMEMRSARAPGLAEAADRRAATHALPGPHLHTARLQMRVMRIDAGRDPQDDEIAVQRPRGEVVRHLLRRERLAVGNAVARIDHHAVAHREHVAAIADPVRIHGRGRRRVRAADRVIAGVQP
ncbi:hypothetical protein QU38_00310, partial [Staphylococcus aureus]